ncbi:hypothetical protein F5X96DRAFT_668883 [Biscogniauxia mediterranea]|nr:hypothetical protein F5X96DRAFT_668883 [Biscogniauxia mediterranea]
MNDTIHTNAIDTFENVTDSTDWLSTPLSGLSAVEAALRCQVCKDFYRTPMLTSCNHTFCSICIRRALSSDGKCPLCRASDQETKLRSNWSMEEVVAAFTHARPAVLDFAQKPPVAAMPRERSPKRKLDLYEDTDGGYSSSQPSNKRLRSSTRLSKSRGMEATAEMARQEVDDQQVESPNFEPDDGLVACPICWRRMKAVQVDKHIDTSCPGEPQPEPSPSRQTSKTSIIVPSAFPSSTSSSSSSPFRRQQQPPSKPLERLPALNYSSLKESQLRKKMSELGISTNGGRQMLERRHREWVTIWNANCDSLRPRRKPDLLHDLDVWERTHGTRAPTTSRSAALGAQIKDKDFDGAAWAARHDSSFKDLIASARRNRAQAQEKRTSSDQADRTPEGEREEHKGGGHRGIPEETEIADSDDGGVIDLTDDIENENAVDITMASSHMRTTDAVPDRTMELGPGTTMIS